MHQRLLFTLLPLAIGLGCGATPPPAAPQGTCEASNDTLPSAGEKDAVGGARIVGTVTTVPWRGMKNGAVVYLEDGPKQPGVGVATAIDNHDMSFMPLISVITAGGTVTFENSDPLVHNAFSPDNEKWDLGTIPQNGVVTKKFDSPGVYSVLCNLHQSMLAYVVVAPSSYFAKTASDGKFAIVGVPPGTYKLTAWAPRRTPSTQSVTVTASGDVVANFKID